VLLDKLKSFWFEISLFISFFVIKSLLSFIVSLDSDEIMWSVMADHIINKEKFYWYFADQNYTGALEAYLIVPFQLLFGINFWTLRINSILFSSLTAFTIYLLIKKYQSSKIYAVSVSIIYLLLLPSNLTIHSKAWGGYVFICFAQLLSFYLALKTIEKKNASYAIFIGLISALAFWSSMQSLYYCLVLIAFFVFVYLHQKGLSIFQIDKLKSLKTEILLALNILFNFYFILNKRLVFNPVITLNEKLGLNLSDSLVQLAAFDIKYGIISMWIIYFLWYLYKKHKDFYHKIIFHYINFLFIGIYINVYFNSFSRVSGEGKGLLYATEFLNNVIFAQFFGIFKYLFIGIIVIGAIINIYRFIKAKQVDYTEILFLTPALLYPLMFVASNVPGLTITARYLIIWWPICVIYLGIFIYKYLNKKFIYLFILLWGIYMYSFREEYQGFLINNKKQQVQATVDIGNVMASNSNYCIGDYWRIGNIMFYSQLEIKCWTEKGIGHDVDYLDDYKLRHNREKTYLIHETTVIE
jgi:hypothetical protein